MKVTYLIGRNRHKKWFLCSNSCRLINSHIYDCHFLVTGERGVKSYYQDKISSKIYCAYTNHILMVSRCTHSYFSRACPPVSTETLICVKRVHDVITRRLNGTKLCLAVNFPGVLMGHLINFSDRLIIHRNYKFRLSVSKTLWTLTCINITQNVCAVNFRPHLFT